MSRKACCHFAILSYVPAAPHGLVVLRLRSFGLRFRRAHAVAAKLCKARFTRAARLSDLSHARDLTRRVQRGGLDGSE